MRALVRTVALLSLAGATLGPAPAAAQAPGIDLELIPKIGAYIPFSGFPTIPQEGTAQEVATELNAGLAVGLAAQLDLLLLPVDLRANLEYATGTSLSSDATQEEIGTNLLVLVGDVVFRPLPLPILSPYVLLGGGIKQYDFETDEQPENVQAFFADQNNWTGHIGLGLDVSLGPIAITAEASDYISWFEFSELANDESELQNDVFIMIGARVGML